MTARIPEDVYREAARNITHVAGELFYRDGKKVPTYLGGSGGYHKFTVAFGGWRNRRSIFVHRMVWFLEHGTLPRGQIDHINDQRLDNRPENLRDVSPHANNAHNKKWLREPNWPVAFGIRNIGPRWTAEISVARKSVRLGSYLTRDEAIAARRGAQRVLFLLHSLTPGESSKEDGTSASLPSSTLKDAGDDSDTHRAAAIAPQHSHVTALAGEVG